MMLDALPLVQHALLLGAVWVLLRIWFAVDRAVYRVSTIILFCAGEYAWAVLAFVLLCIAESAHRGLMARRRAADLYNGPWID